MQGRHKAAFFYSKYFYSKRHIPLFSFPYNCKRKQAARTQAASKRLQRHARDAKPRGKALSEYA